MLRLTALFILLLVLPCRLRAQDTIRTPGTSAFSVNFQHGFLIAHRPSIVHLQHDHVQGIEISWRLFPNTSNNWFPLYNFPMVGFTYQYFDLGNRQELGSGHALMPEIMFPLLKHPHLRLTAKLSIGAGYIEKPFNADNNYKNLAIGSHWNCAISSGVLIHSTCNSHFNVFGGIQFTHFSNGASRIPNLGLNLASATAGLQYFIGPEKILIRTSDSHRREGVKTDLSVAAGLKQVAPPGSRLYKIVILNGTVLKDVTPKSMLGGGADVFIDTSMPSRLEADSLSAEGLGAHIRSGIFGAYGLHVGRCEGLFQTGVYTFSRLKEDGTIYSRLAIRYFFSEKLFASFNLKTHFAKADSFEWGIGYSFHK